MAQVVIGLNVIDKMLLDVAVAEPLDRIHGAQTICESGYLLQPTSLSLPK